MLRGAILSLFSVMALSLSVFAQAQSQHSSEYYATSDEGRFRAKIGTSSETALRAGNGFIKSIDIEIQWWSLLNQSVEHYGFRWTRGDSFKLDSGETLRRADLEEYPDLVKRYDDLKPSAVTLSFDANLSATNSDVSRITANANIKNIGETFYPKNTILALASGIRTNFL